MIQHKITKNLFSTCMITALSLSACGGGGDDDNSSTNNPGTPPTGSETPVTGEPKDAKVINLSLATPVFSPRESSVVNITVTYGESRVLTGGQRVIVVTKLPPGVIYEEDSTGVTTDTSSTNASPTVTPCSNGSSFIAFDLGSNELRNATDPDGREDADFNLIFGVDSPDQSGVNVITAAAADNTLSYSCDSDFSEEASTGITVQ